MITRLSTEDLACSLASRCGQSHSIYASVDDLTLIDRVLDLSFNVLRSVPEVVTTLANLDTVYFVQNKITKIPLLQGPGWSTKLRSLELGANRIRVRLRSSVHLLVNLVVSVDREPSASCKLGGTLVG
jgi:hypothetical protein